MLNPNYRLTPHDADRSLVSWEAPSADHVSWVYVNGDLVVGPFYAGEKARSIRIPHPAGAAVAVEIHDVVSDEEPVEAVFLLPNQVPDLCWNQVTGAIRYRIYHREQGGVESLIHSKDAIDGQDSYRIRCPLRLSGQGGVWHFFRIEAGNNFGYWSVREAWVYFVTEPPVMPAGLAIVDGSAPGLFNFQIT